MNMATSKSECEPLKTFISSKQGLRARVNPLVLLTILDCYARKPKKERRAIGTLMGYVSEGDILEITDAFQVVHSDQQAGGVSMDIKYHQRMLSLRQSVHNKEQVLGWFSVGEGQTIDESTTAIHTFYSKTKESKFAPQPQLNFFNPVYLQVDTDLRDVDKPIAIQAWTHEMVVHSEGNLAQFSELPLILNPSETGGGQEKQILDMLSAAALKSSDLRELVQVDTHEDAFSRQLLDLQSLFVRSKAYIQDVIDGKAKAEPAVGRALSQALSDSSLFLDDKKVEEMVESATKDTLMVTYLASVCKTQITLAEKIQGVLARQQEQS